jgi:hypothetical protein
MKYRVFLRQNWVMDPSYPEGVRPQTVRSTDCETVAVFDDVHDARARCAKGNEPKLAKGSFQERVTTPTYEYELVPDCFRPINALDAQGEN